MATPPSSFAAAPKLRRIKDGDQGLLHCPSFSLASEFYQLHYCLGIEGNCALSFSNYDFVYMLYTATRNEVKRANEQWPGCWTPKEQCLPSFPFGS